MIRRRDSGAVVWLFGRGLSIGCGLTWDVPSGLDAMTREEKIELVKSELLVEMHSHGINTGGICAFLNYLRRKTSANWHHMFVTTNWDYLIQQEVLCLGSEDIHSWLPDNHVYHLNGTVEVLPGSNDNFRSPFLLPEDDSEMRTSTPEAGMVYNKMIWERTFVVVGMSFECETDKFLLQSLNRVEDDLPIGESVWIVVDPNMDVLRAVSAKIQHALPCAQIAKVCMSFDKWRDSAFPELVARGVFSA